MLNQQALELEWTDLVIRTFEDIVIATYIGKIPATVAPRDVPGMIVATGHDGGGIDRVTQIPGHHRQRILPHRYADIALLARFPIRIQQLDVVSGQDASHRAGHDLLARAVADLCRCFGLPIAIPYGESPR